MFWVVVLERRRRAWIYLVFVLAARTLQRAERSAKKKNERRPEEGERKLQCFCYSEETQEEEEGLFSKKR